MIERDNFNEVLWKNLLKVQKERSIIPTVQEICEYFGISNRQAYAYRFALVNQKNISLPLESIFKLRNLNNTISTLNGLTKILEKENNELKARVDFLSAIKIVDNTDFAKIKISQADMSIDENTALSVLSDIHIEETVLKEVVNGMNEYNPSIAKRRIELYFKRLMFVIINLRKGGWKINNLVLALLGDLINGYIHDEFIEDNSMSPTEATILIQELLIKGITFLVNEGNFKHITIVCSRGNHGRTSQKKKFSSGYKNSYEWMMYTQLMRHFQDKPGFEHVKFLVSKSEFTRVQIYDKTWVFGHGDHFRYAGGVGGMMIPFKRWIYKMMQIIPADKYCIGHWHSYFNLPDGMSNGSVVGYNAFAMGHGFAPEPPQQQFQLQDSKRGFTVNTPVILEDW